MQQKQKLLWIEDQEIYRETAKELFGGDYQIEFAANYQQALERANGNYDLIVSDYHLKEGDDRTGANVHSVIRTGGVKTPFVYVSSTFPSAIEAKKESLGLREKNLVIPKAMLQDVDTALFSKIINEAKAKAGNLKRL